MVSSFTGLGELKDISPCHSALLSSFSLLLDFITFYLILFITISIFSMRCNKYLFRVGISMFFIDKPRLTFSVIFLNQYNSSQFIKSRNICPVGVTSLYTMFNYRALNK